MKKNWKQRIRNARAVGPWRLKMIEVIEANFLSEARKKGINHRPDPNRRASYDFWPGRTLAETKSGRVSGKPDYSSTTESF